MREREIATLTDLQFAARLLQRDLDKMYNKATPKAQKLKSTIRTLKNLDVMIRNGSKEDD